MSILQPKLSSAYLLIQGRVHFKVTSMRKGCSHTNAKSSSAVGEISVSNKMSSFRSTAIIEFISQLSIRKVYRTVVYRRLHQHSVNCSQQMLL